MEKNRNDAMKKLMAADFAAYELQLYLDTHPNDSDAMKLYCEAVKAAAAARSEYEMNFGPITAASAAGSTPWQWIMSPWNWE